MWHNQSWRNDVWQTITATTPQTPLDILIIGGGITGAGILREAARLGLRALLVEMRDFAWGTSSRSSKLVHGGLRYLKEGKIGLTWASVHERERLLASAPGLVEPLGFLIATYKGDKPGKLTYRAGLELYDLIAANRSYLGYNAEDFKLIAPYVADENLQGGFSYRDAQTDDARLTLRVIQEAVAEGAQAINYVKADALLRDADQVIGARLHDSEANRSADVYARVVINATGAWADDLRGQLGKPARIRPLRGSHLVFPAWRFPVAQAISFLHPLDRRPVFAFPWEGATLVGTTDLDHADALNAEPRISGEEVAYLMAALAHQFPKLNLSLEDVLATFAGVRPVIGTGKEDPSKESRDHVIWQEHGLLTVTGGKLTTFRIIALDALKAARALLPEIPHPDEYSSPLETVEAHSAAMERLADMTMRNRLLGRHGAHTFPLLEAAQADELTPIPGTATLWAELRWAARAEGVVHLDDLLLRRTRLGLLLKEGGAAHFARIRAICQPELGWDDGKWQEEEAAYRRLWLNHYSLPERATIPNWNAQLEAVYAQQLAKLPKPKARSGLRAAAVLSALGGLLFLLRRRRA